MQLILPFICLRDSVNAGHHHSIGEDLLERHWDLGKDASLLDPRGVKIMRRKDSFIRASLTPAITTCMAEKAMDLWEVRKR
jgi:purine nucleoside permease